MWILDRYLLREILKSFLLSLVMFTVVFFLAALYELLREGAGLQVIARIIGFVVFYSVPYLIPIALAIGCALAYGRLVADNEVIPCLTGGLHPFTLVRPGLFAGLLLTIVMYGVQATLVPYAYSIKKSVLQKVVEDLLALPDTEHKTLTDGKRGFFFYARRTNGPDIEGLQLTGFPGAIGVPGAASKRKGGGRVELTADHGRIEQQPDGRITVDVRQAEVTVFSAESLKWARLDQDQSGQLTPPEWLAVTERLRLEPREETPSFRAADTDRSGSVARAEFDAYVAELDPTEVGNRGFYTLRFARLTFDIVPALRRGYKMAFRNNHQLLAFHDQSERWIEAAHDGGALAAARTSAAALSAALAAAPGASPAGALSAASSASAVPGKHLRTIALEQRRHASAHLHQRAVLSLAPLLFALIAVTLPLLLRSNVRLLPFFVAFSVIALTYFGPFMIGMSLAEKGRGPEPWMCYWPAPLISGLTGLYLLRRLFRQ
ncbi:MAG: LptF/LptG family permease [Planctomycetota bacterium]|jgi:lipopolysaccharide export LptBFGC system permease protein LptF